MPRIRPVPPPFDKLAPAPARLFAGTSGWAYPSWKPEFYPATIPAKKFLPFYASRLNSVEVNYTFRKLPPPATLADWLAATPAGFRMSFKAPQRITHFSRLRDCNTHVTELFDFLKPAHAAAKLGPVLFQLPPNLKANPELLRTFLAIPALQTPQAPQIAFEFRHPSWFVAETEAILRQHNAALCIAETEDLQSPEWHTATTHTCFRLRRTGGYKPRQVTALAQRLLALTADRDVYAYFKHEEEPTGALNAQAFLRAACKRSKTK